MHEYLFLDAHSFPRATLSENCSLLGTDNIRGQISVHIFARNGDYCLYILFKISNFFKYRVFERKKEIKRLTCFPAQEFLN